MAGGGGSCPTIPQIPIFAPPVRDYRLIAAAKKISVPPAPDEPSCDATRVDWPTFGGRAPRPTTPSTRTGPEIAVCLHVGARRAPFTTVIDELEREGAIQVSTGDYFGKTIRHFHSTRLPDRLSLTEPQRGIVEYWIKNITDEHTAQSISEQSHDYAWEIAKLGEEIPYHAIFATRIRDPEGEELKWASSRAKELGLG